MCLIMFILISTILSLLIAVAAWFLSDKDPDKEKLSPYECGFDPFGQTGHPISIKFFLVAILFLVFDLEVSLLLPWSFSLSQTEWFNQIIVWVFLIILAWGLLYEWIAGGLEWE
uniref:NADH-ubiquinone oxidoreductase chain 3 n=1 Tax=Carybdea alata TaxID=1193083 RepID=G9IBY0_CARAL|nr:NADH dehydrogenase subunit 3 [Alatina alata]